MSRALPFAALLALAAGCSSLPNPLDMLSGRSSGPKPAEVPAIANAQPVKVLWSASVGGAERYIFSPAVVGDAVFAAARDGSVVRLDAASGQQRWRASVERRISAGVGADARTVAVATEDGEVIVLDAATGALRWRARVSSEVLARPAVGGGRVIVRSADNRIFGFNESDGKRAWVYQRAASPLMIRSPAGVSILNDTAFAGFSGGKLAAIALATGALRWEGTVALPKGSTELERVADVVGEPAVQGREVCAAAYQGRIACFELASGRQLWSREVSSLTGVTLDARLALASDERGGVHALDRSSGRSLWKQDRLALRQLSVPLATGNAVAVGDFEGYVHFMARDSGAFIARHPTGGGAVRAQLAPLGGAVLVQTQNGGLLALSL